METKINSSKRAVFSVALFLQLNLLFLQSFNAQICGIKTVGSTGDYPTLTSAFTAASSGLCGNLIFELQSTYTSGTEVFPLSVPTIATSTNTITIRPEAGVAGLSINGSNATAILNFNGAKYVSFDGRPGGLGSSKELTIENTMIAATSATIRFINEASNNTIAYCNIKGAETSSSCGVVFFSTSTAASGNSFNIIDNCDIRDGIASPANGIFSLGAAGMENESNTVSNCNIFNYHHPTSACGGIRLVTNNSGWAITGNSFYQTVARSTTSTTYAAIQLSASSGNNFTISDNYIGGNAPNAVGTYSITCPTFRVLNILAGTTVASNINNNTITNINYTSSTNNNLWTGIIISNGLVNIGTLAGNNIGNASGNGAITINNTGAANGTSYAIQSASTSTVNISNNIMGSITLTGTSAFPNTFKAISSASPGAISNNTIGSTSTALSIQNNAYSGAQPAFVFGIENNNTPSVISGNTIANMSNRSTSSSTSNQIKGIAVSPSSNNSVNISNNIIRDLSSSAANNSSIGANVPVCGIYLGGTGTGVKIISANSIYNLSNTNAFNDITVAGIIYNNPSALDNVIERNTVHSLQLSTLSTFASITGIGILNGASTIKNNMVSLGFSDSGASISNEYAIKGIFKNTPMDNGFYYNSISIGGTGVGINNTNTVAFENAAVGAGDVIKNNIFTNNRSNSSTGGSHYSIIFNTVATSDHNAYYFNGNGGKAGIVGAADYATLDLLKAGTARDAASVFAEPHFISNTDLHINNSLPSALDSGAVEIPFITSDIDGDIRSSGATAPDIGADEFISMPLVTDLGVTALINPATTACYSANEMVRVEVKNFSSETVNFSFAPLTINCSVTGINPLTFPSLTLNMGTLAAGATLDTALATSYDMSAFGIYTFKASTSITGDVDVSNDTITVIIDNTIAASTDLTVCAGIAATLTAIGSGSYTWSPTAGLSASVGSSVNASPAITTAYTVTGACGNTAMVRVNANPLPVLVSSENRSICAGESTALSVAGADFYDWSPSAGLNVNSGTDVAAAPLATTTYTVTGTDLNQCMGNAVILIIVDQSPIVAIEGNLAICSGNSTVLTAAATANYYSWSTGQTTSSISVSLPGNYSVTVTGSNGCSGTGMVAVLAESSPVLTTSENQTICQGGFPVLLCAGGGGAVASTITWSPQIGLSSSIGPCVNSAPLSTTMYVVSGTGINACVGTDSISVTVKALPTISVSGDLTLCYGEVATLTASGSETYLWSPAADLNTATGDVVTANPQNTTMYSVTGYLNECSKTESFVLAIDPCTGIPPLSFGEGQGVRCFPNPSNGIVNMAADFNISTDFIIRLVNLKGEIIYEETKYAYAGTYSTAIDISQQSKGLYMLQLLTDSENSARKIILE